MHTHTITHPNGVKSYVQCVGKHDYKPQGSAVTKVAVGIAAWSILMNALLISRV
jgi:hypothetical protein